MEFDTSKGKVAVARTARILEPYLGIRTRPASALSVGIPSHYATLQEAWDDIADKYDLAGNGATITLAPGTHTGGLVATKAINGSVFITGNDKSDTTISTTNADCLNWINCFGTVVNISKLKLETASAGDCIDIAGSATALNVDDVDFGDCAGVHVSCSHSAEVLLSPAYNVSGDAVIHWAAASQGIITCHSTTITFAGGQAFTIFASAANHAQIYADGMTFTNAGAVTGSRYSVDTLALLQTGTGSGTYLPGNAAGATAHGGLYL